MTTPSGWAPETERLRHRAQRRSAGMGFWRLVFVVALGVLLAQAAGAVALWLFGKLTAGGG